MKRFSRFFWLTCVSCIAVLSCKKEDPAASISYGPMAFNVYLFSKDGVDLFNPKNDEAVSIENVSIEGEVDGKTVNGWEKELWSPDVLENLYAGYTFYYSGFYCCHITAPKGGEVSLGRSLINRSVTCHITLKNEVTHELKVLFNDIGIPKRIIIDELVLNESLSGSYFPFFYIKLSL